MVSVALENKQINDYQEGISRNLNGTIRFNTKKKLIKDTRQIKVISFKMMAFSFGVGGRVLLIITHLLLIWTHHTLADDDQVSSEEASPPPDDPNVVPDDTVASGEGGGGAGGGAGEEAGKFIEPIAINPNVEVVAYKGKEYLLVDIKVMHDFAEMMCPSYFSATLASIPNLELANLLSDALAETSLEFESLWIGGKNSSAGSWKWIKNNYSSDSISEDILNLVGNGDAVADLERHCLAFAREHHQKPQFKNLDCFVDRPFMCERARGSSEGNQTTHPGWITIGSRLYKIFHDKVDYYTAGMNCFAANPNATLAVLDNMEIVTQMARYLLIGRPSLENAWIGAKWVNSKYEFEADSSILLENTTNPDTNFPPWRDGVMQRPGGCLLLDRHLTDTPLFVETRCPRLRPYICSRPAYNISTETNYTETQFEERVYRAYFHAQPWAAAQATCLEDSGTLVEPDGKEMMEELLYVMGQNFTTFNHIWLGGRYMDDQWMWESNKAIIDTNAFPFLQNNSYVEVIEEMNTCLNMDRENHIVGIFYGTNCYYPQHFVCILNPSVKRTGIIN